MEIIQFKEANCKGCYKCIRNCEIKAIKFANDQARIMENECILCGKCTQVCPQNAKVIKSDLPEIKKMLASGDEVWVSMAPSYITLFPGKTFGQVTKALKALGFKGAEETAVGASMVTREYVKLVKEGRMKNIITTCCPTVNLLVEKFYPELVPFMAPVVAPATAHAKAIKQAHAGAKVVFVGPCISKKFEASLTDASGNCAIDHVIMFDELLDWMEENGIKVEEEDENLGLKDTRSRFYPVPRGIIYTMEAAMESASREEASRYRPIALDGIERCIEALDSLSKDGVEGYFLEMSACAGSCVAGPGMSNSGQSLLIAKDTIAKDAKSGRGAGFPTEDLSVDLHKSFDITLVKDKVPDEDSIRSILASIGKNGPEQMLNCGACGYSTCRDKAIAVFQGKADLKMCLPYMREKAESMSNIILENTPDAIFVTDTEFNLLEYNPSAAHLFPQLDENSIGLPIEMYIDSENFHNVRSKGENIYYALCKDSTGETYLDVSIIHAPNRDYIVICKDVTADRLKNEELAKLRRDTLETTQKIIDKQMRAAQEIASLLGETTGETKAALSNLKRSIAAER